MKSGCFAFLAAATALFVVTAGARLQSEIAGAKGTLASTDGGKTLEGVSLPLHIAAQDLQNGLDAPARHFGRTLAPRTSPSNPTLGLGTSYLDDAETDKALQVFQQVVVAGPGGSEAKQAGAFVAGLKKPGSPEARNEERSSA